MKWEEALGVLAEEAPELYEDVMAEFKKPDSVFPVCRYKKPKKEVTK